GVGIFYLVIFIFMIVCWWRIWSKAGFSGAWSLLMFVPIANLISFIYLAFAKWPVSENKVKPETFD
ncbi:hypothetical protein, partial [Ponticaulis profundi]